ncbi:MAG: Mut7-C RNAse domain-containing protein [Rhodoplanes sp.]
MATTRPTLTMSDVWRFLCDEMLAGLGRWLRIAGYDTVIAARGCRDRDLVEQAHAEQRILLTRDRRLVEIRRANDRTIVLQGNGVDACAKELAQRLSLDWSLDPLSRCTLRNTPLDLADHRLLGFLPPRIRTLGSTAKACPRCGRLYWEGAAMFDRRRLAGFAQQREHGRAD